MVLALSLPQNFAYRDLIVSMTFGVAVLSILLQGTTMSFVLVRLGIAGEPPRRSAFEVRRGRVQAIAAALAEIDRISQQRLAPPELLEPIRQEYRALLKASEQDLHEVAGTAQAVSSADLRRMRLRVLAVERDRVMRAYRHRELSSASRDTLLAEIDARLLRLEATEAARAP
jgi:CPA1 family monovalent cation:H+ antiporter